MGKLTRISFQTAEFDELLKVVSIKMCSEKAIFSEWFSFAYLFSTEEETFLIDLVNENSNFLFFCLEEDLKMEFISPILRKVNFRSENKRGFFERSLKATINNVEIGGITDFMFAMGIEKPQKPYFFIQEFKQEGKSTHPRNQLLAELLVAMELNKTTLMRGAYIIGRYWHFAVLQKNEKNEYQYCISDVCDSLTINGLRQIFICLQAVKQIYCV